MRNNNVINSYLEKIELLPDDCEIAVSRVWCSYAAIEITKTSKNDELVKMINSITKMPYQKSRPLAYVPRYVTLVVRDIKIITSLCDVSNFNCCFPENYDKIMTVYLSSILGDIKDKIEYLMKEDCVDNVLNLIETVEDVKLKRIALLYTKYVHNLEYERKIMDFNITRIKTIKKIDSKIY